MKVLVIGSGGREHALVWKLRQSPRVSKVYCAPGNGGIADEAECLPADVKNVESLVALAHQIRPDLTLVGPELPLPNSTGPTVTIAVLDINCAHTAAHDFMVTVTPGGDSVQVIDNGKGPDLAKKDGILTGEWTPSPCHNGDYTFTFPNGKSVTTTLTC